MIKQKKFEAKSITRAKNSSYKIVQEDIAIINLYESINVSWTHIYAWIYINYTHIVSES